MRTQSICLALAIVLLCPFASGQWISASGPPPLNARIFFSQGNAVYAGTSSGVRLSTDAGLTWTENSNGLPQAVNIRALAAIGSDLFAAAPGSGVFRTTDNGKGWFPINTGLPDWIDFSAMVAMDEVLFTGGGRGVYISTNRGGQWTKTGSGNLVSPGSVKTLTVVGTSLFATTQGQAYFSSDKGATWSETGSGLPLNVPVVQVMGSHLFAGSYWDGAFTSTDTGKTWNAVNSGLTDYRIIAFAAVETTLFAGTEDSGIFRSTDYGKNWVMANVGLTVKRILRLGVAGTTILAEPWGGTLFRSTNLGENWELVDVGIPRFAVQALAVKGKDIYASVFQGGRGWYGVLYHSSNEGETWRPELSSYVSSICIKDTDVFCGTPYGVQSSSIHGSDWFQANNGLSQYPWVTSIVHTDSILFLGTSGNGVYRSSDDGEHWIAVIDSFPRGSTGVPYQHVGALTVCGRTLFAGTDQGVYCWPVDGGLWAQTSGALTDFAASGFSVAGGALLAWTWTGVFRSTDNGDHWTRFFFDSADSVASSIASGPAGNLGTELFAACSRGWIFHSTDRGFTWIGDSVAMAGPPAGESPYVGAMVAGNEYLYVGTGSDEMGGAYGAVGIWKRHISDFATAVAVNSSRVPAAFRLLQNYPNPFNPSTTIKFDLPRASQVNLTVYDILGREVSVLVNERRDAGVHEAKFDGSTLASGVYFYRLQAGDFASTRRLVMVK